MTSNWVTVTAYTHTHIHTHEELVANACVLPVGGGDDGLEQTREMSRNIHVSWSLEAFNPLDG